MAEEGKDLDDKIWRTVIAIIEPWTRGYRKVGECEVCRAWLVVGPGGFKTQMRCPTHFQADPLW